jgi:hypothetical protein
MRHALVLACLAAAAGCAPGGGDALGPSENQAPVIRSITTVPDRVPVGGTAEIRVDALDPDGDRLFFQYAAEAGTISVPDATNPNHALYVQNGAVRPSDRITVKVVDTSNAGTTSVAVLPLQGNQPPVVELDWVIDERSCHPECALTVHAVARDADGDALSYTWSGCTSGTQATARCEIVAPGVFTAAVVVRDAFGGVTSVSEEAVGVNEPPSVRGGRTVSGPNAALRVTHSDPDGDRLTCGWSGDCTCTGQQGSFDLTCTVPAGAGTCGMRFVCSDAFGATGHTDFTVLP